MVYTSRADFVATGLIAIEQTLAKPTVIPRDAHTLSRSQVSAAALKVLYRLKDAGFAAYLVGGCVRDLLLGLTPKDFDIATDAMPEQVTQLFRNSRVIGRRFRIVHVRFGQETIEVSTFRAHHSPFDEEDPDTEPLERRRSDSGMILRDNVYGRVDEDAGRRDFTINALYYDIRDFTLHDYADGLRDLNARQIRMIGDPAIRYREDPVRMLRAVRFAAKLDFTLAEETLKPIRTLRTLLLQVPAARLFDEVIKLFLTGHGLSSFQLLRAHGLFETLFPATQASIEAATPFAVALIEAAMHNTDLRLAEERPVNPAFIFAVLLWPVLTIRQQQLQHDEGLPPIAALHQAAHEVLGEQVRITAIPRRFSTIVIEIWELQWRLPRRTPAAVAKLIAHPRFRAGYDFLLLREQAGEALDGLGQWWSSYQIADEAERTALVATVTPPQSRRRSRVRRRKSRD